MPILKLPFALRAVCPALLLSACATTDLPPPDESRTARVVLPALPAGEAACDDDGDGQTEPCLSDRQTGALINNLITQLCAASNQIDWLHQYLHGDARPPLCGSAH
jgi:hypothetical protein